MMALWRHLVALLPFAWARYAFMQHALLAVIAAAVLYGLLGALLVNQQMAFFSDAIGHAALTGIALGVVLGLGDPLWAMIGVAVLLAAAITVVKRASGGSADTTIGLFMSFAVALGVVILSRGGGFARYSAYLVGDVLSITPGEIGRLIVLIALVVVFYAVFFNQAMFVSLNASLAGSRRINVRAIELLFALLVAVAVTVSIRWVGLLVINSLLILPAAAARNRAGTIARYLWQTLAVSLFSGVAGLIASYYLATATGATMVLFAMGCYLVSLAFKRR